MTYQEVIDKIQKLLRLATSDNPNESAAAAAKAQDLIDRYQIEAASLLLNGQEDNEPIKDFGTDPLETGIRIASWKIRLSFTLAKLNSCKLYLNDKKPALIGRPSDVSAVRYLYGWLSNEVERLAHRDCNGNGRTWANNYRIGVVETVCSRLIAQKIETRETLRQETIQLALKTSQDQSLALVKVNQAISKVEKRLAAVESWTREHLRLVKNHRSVTTYNGAARAAGQQAGHEVRFTQACASLTK